MSIEELRASNLAHFMERGPGLSYGYSTWIEAKDTPRRKVLVAGLGGMGVGRMWFDEQDSHREMEGYAEASEVDSEPPMEVTVREWFADDGRKGVDITVQGTMPQWGDWSDLNRGVRLPKGKFDAIVAGAWSRMTKDEQRTALAEYQATFKATA